MNAYITPAAAGTAAYALVNDSLIGPGRIASAALAFSTEYFGGRTVENLSQSIVGYADCVLSYAGGYESTVRSVAETAVSVGMKALAVYAGMYAVSAVVGTTAITLTQSAIAMSVSAAAAKCAGFMTTSSVEKTDEAEEEDLLEVTNENGSVDGGLDTTNNLDPVVESSVVLSDVNSQDGQ